MHSILVRRPKILFSPAAGLRKDSLSDSIIALSRNLAISTSDRGSSETGGGIGRFL